MIFTDPKTKEKFEIDNKLFNAINHSQALVRKSTTRDIKKKLSLVMKVESKEEIKKIILTYIEENKWILN